MRPLRLRQRPSDELVADRMDHVVDGDLQDGRARVDRERDGGGEDECPFHGASEGLFTYDTPMQGFDAEKGRWFLGGCVAVFALPFAIGGVNILTAGIRALHRGEGSAPVLLAIGTGFTALSVAFVALIAFAMRQAQAAARRRNLNPMQPWLWRDDWAARRVAEANPRGRAALLIFALMWNAITIPIAVLVARQFPRNLSVAIVFVFAAIGLALLGAAAYAASQRWKFGRSICTIDRLPIEPGQRFSGQIEHRGTQVPDAGYRFVLSCVNRIITGSGRSRSAATQTLWETEQRVSGALAAPSPVGMRVPFAFDLPADAPSSDLSKPNDLVLWQLAVAAELPGIDYKAAFELPVFVTAGEAAAHHAARRQEAARRELSPASRATATPLPSGGVELRVGPHRDAGAFTTFVFFAAIWFGVIALMWRLGAPIFIAGFFSLFGLLILAMAVDFFTGTSIVSADSAGLRTRHALLGMSRSKSIEAAQVDSIASKVGGHYGHHPYFDVEARLKDQSSRTLARYFVNRDDADVVAAKLWEGLGR